MGCVSTSDGHGANVLVIYSSDVGWSSLANDVCVELLKVDKNIVIDCRAAGSVTGQIQIFLDKNGKQQLVFAGNKVETQSQLNSIGAELKKKISQ